MNEVIEIPVEELNQVKCIGDIRHKYDEGFIEVLASTLKKSGQLTPCEGWVEEIDGVRKIFIDAGENRYRAAVKAQVPLKVKIGGKRNPLGILKSAMIENTHTPMTPADEIHLCTRVVKESGGNFRSAAKLFAEAGRTDYPQARIKKLYELGQVSTDKVLDIIANPDSSMTLNRLAVLAQKQFGLTDTEIEAYATMVDEGVKRFDVVHEELRSRLRPKMKEPREEKPKPEPGPPKELGGTKERKPQDKKPFDPFSDNGNPLTPKVPEALEDLRDLLGKMTSLMGSKTPDETKEILEGIKSYVSLEDGTKGSISDEVKAQALDVLVGHDQQEDLYKALGLISVSLDADDQPEDDSEGEDE